MSIRLPDSIKTQFANVQEKIKTIWTWAAKPKNSIHTVFDCSKIIARTTLEVSNVSNGNSGQGKTEQQ